MLRRLFVETLEDRRLLNADWRNPVDSIDVDGDGAISPLDALTVINYINAQGTGTLPAIRSTGLLYLDVDGDQGVSALDVLNVVNHINTNGVGIRSLAESESRFIQETSVTITLGHTSGTREFGVRIDSHFDTSDRSSALEDLLAVYLVDPADPTQTLLDRGINGTALFTLAGTKAEFIPGRVRWDGSVLTINVSDVASRNTGVLKFQLLKADADSGSRVAIQPLSNEVDVEGTLAPKWSMTSAPHAAGGSLNLSSLSPVDTVHVQVGNVRLEPSTGRFSAELKLRNDGDSIGREVAVSFPGLPSSVSLRGRSGTTPEGYPYLNVKPAIQRGGLARSSWSETVALEFDNPSLVPFSIRPKLFASANRAPTLATIPALTAMPGGVLQARLSASDPDGDFVSYSLKASDGSVSMATGEINSSGVLTFKPSPSQVGTYQFEVSASDGVLETTRSVVLNVVPDPITTTRVSGKILQVNGQPIAGMPIQIGSVQGLTSADGSFTLDLGSGTVVSDAIKVRGELYSGPKVYPFIAEKLAFILEHEVYANVNNLIERPIYLPEIDVASGKAIDPLRNTVVTSSALPGASVEVAASTLMNQQGTPFTGILSMTEVPVTLTPAALPEGLLADLVVTIQPGEMVFTTPTPLSLPNRGGYAPGSLMDLWSINPITGEFDKVGTGQVSSNGSVIETISGGIRNSSWHFFGPPASSGPRVKKKEPEVCPLQAEATSSCEMYSGALLETHELVTYRSQEVTRGIVLTYDSLRADPRPIVRFTFDELDPNQFSVPSAVRLIAELDVSRNGITTEVPGFAGGHGLNGNKNIWRLEPEAGSVGAALQVDLRDQPTGVYDYTLRSGMLGYAGERGFIGTLNESTGQFTSVNSRNSYLGSGWGIAGLLELVENSDGSVLIINGDGSETLYPKQTDGQFDRPSGEFARLSKLPNGTFQRVWPDQTVERYGSNKKLISLTDRNGNETRYEYDSAERLTKLTDPVGLETTLSYSPGVVEINDPASRKTRLNLDGNGNLIRVTDPDGSTRQWRYDSEHRMTGETDPLGNVESSNYGFHGRVTDVVRKDGTVRQYFPIEVQGLFRPEQTAADPILTPLANPIAGRISLQQSSFVDVNGNLTQSLLDDRSQSVSERDSLGSLPNVSRDQRNLPVTVIDARGYVTLNTFDQQGNLLTSQDNLSVRLGENPSMIGLMAGDFRRNGEKDLYRFIGKAGERDWIDKIREKFSSSLAIAVYTPSGTKLREDMDQLPENGTYTVQVTGPQGAYVGAIRSMSLAEQIEWGKQTHLSIAAGEDVVYRFNAERDQRLVFQHSSPAESDRWIVIGPNGTEVWPIRFPNGPVDEFQILMQDSGEYYLIYEVRASDSINPQTIQFTANLIDSVPQTKMGYGTTYSGSLQPNEEREYKFSGSQGSLVYFELQRAYSGAILELRDPQDRILEQSEIDSFRNRVFQLPSSGTFKLLLKGPLNQVTGYGFTIVDLESATPAQFDSTINGNFANDRSAIYRLSGIAGQRFVLSMENASPRIISSDSSYQESYLDGILTLPHTGEYFFIFDKTSSPTTFRFSSLSLNRIPMVDMTQDIKGTFTTRGEQQYFRFQATPNSNVFVKNLGISFITSAKIVGEGVTLFDGLYNQHANLTSYRGESDYNEFVLIAKYPMDADDRSPHNFGFRLLPQSESEKSILFGQTVSGRLEINEIESFTFQGRRGTTLHLDRRSMAGPISTGLRWEWIGPDGNQLSLQSNAEMDFGPFTLPATGSYRLRLSYPYGTQPLNYEFRLTDIASVPRASIQSPFSGQLDSGSEAQWFQFDASAGQRLRLEQSTPSTRLQVYSPSGRLISDTGTNLVQHIGISETGLHRILVIGRDQNSVAPVSYEWLISLANDTPVSMLGFDTLIAGTARDGDIVATFSGNAGQQILFRQTGFYDPYRSDCVQIAGPSGSIIATAPTDGDLNLVLPDSGVYSVRVVGRNSPFFGTVPYAFILEKYSSITRMNPGTTYPFPSPSPRGIFETFAFEATAGQELTIDMIWPDSFNGGMPYSPVSLYVESPDGSMLASTTSLESSPFSVAKSGTHLVRVYVHNGQPLALRLLRIDIAPKVSRDTLLTGTNSLRFEDVIRRFDVAAGESIRFQTESTQWMVGRHSETKGYWENNEIVWTYVETGPNTFQWEGTAEFSQAGTYTLRRSGSAQAPLDYGIVLSAQAIKPVSPLSGGALSMTKQTYDPTFSQLTSHTDQQGRRTEFDIDPMNGNTRSVTRIVGQRGGNDDLLTSFTYLASGQIDTETDPMGRVLDLDYDAQGRLRSRKEAKGTLLETRSLYEYDAAGNLSAVVDENGHRTTYQYDSMNRIVRLTQPDPDGGGPLASPITTFTYDAAGNLRTVTDPLGRTTSSTYDSLNRLSSETDSGQNTTKYAYDQAGNITSVTDQLGNVTRMQYDDRNRVTTTTDAAGFATRFKYDADNNMTSVTDASGNVTQFLYDARDRLISETDPMGNTKSYSYNGANELVAQLDRLGRTTRFEYDDLGRLVQEHWFAAQNVETNSVHYAYDAASRITRVQDASSSYQVTYDALDRPVREQTGGGNGAPSAILDRTYDSVGNVLSTMDTIDGVIGGINEYSYDALNRLTTLTQARAVGSMVTISEKRVDIKYNGQGQLASLSRFGDMAGLQLVATTSFTYDTLNRLMDISHRNPVNALLNSFAFSYDSANRITRVGDIDGATQYAYDQRDQLTSANHADTANPDELYTYDATGNRKSSHQHGTRYVVGDGGLGKNGNNRLTSDGTYQYAYDLEGNLISRTQIDNGAVREFTWDHRNRLTRVVDRSSSTGAPTQVVEYTYDAMNRRLTMKVDTTPADAVDGAITAFVYDGDNVLADLIDSDGSGPAPSAMSMRYLHGPSVDQVLAQESASGGVQWMLTDHLGTVRDLVNDRGEVVNHLKYDSYGNVLSESNPTVETRYKYTGREFDAETAMQYNRARYYDAAIGRFLSEDPIGFEGGDANIYRYVESNPVSNRDPSGMSAFDETSSGSAANQRAMNGAVRDIRSKTPSLPKLRETLDTAGYLGQEGVAGLSNALAGIHGFMFSPVEFATRQAELNEIRRMIRQLTAQIERYKARYAKSCRPAGRQTIENFDELLSMRTMLMAKEAQLMGVQY